MSRIDRRILGLVCRSVAIATFVTWFLGCGGLVLVAWADARSLLAAVQDLDGWLGIAALGLPTALQIGVPLGTTLAVFVLAESGELSGGASVGRSPWRTSAVAALPGVVLIAAALDLVHSARPAAESRLRDDAYRAVFDDPRIALDRVRDRRFGATTTGDGVTRALAAVGSSAIGVHARVEGGVAPALRDARFSVLERGDRRASLVGSATRIALAVPEERPRSLGVRVESEMSSGALRTHETAWQLDRATRLGSAPDSQRRIDAERRRRLAVLLSLALGLGVAASASWFGVSPSRRRHALVGAAAVLVATLLPRVCT